MLRKNGFVLLTTALVLGFWSVAIAVAAEDSARQSPDNEATWDDGALPGGLAMMQAPEEGPPGPPPAKEDGPRPPREKRDAGRRPGPAHDERGPMPGSMGGPGMIPGGPYPHRGMEFGGLGGRGGMGMPFMDSEDGKLHQENMELERQTRELAHEYRQATAEEREKIKTKLEEIINRHFDVRLQLRTSELKRLEKELQHLREIIERRQKARDEIVKKRFSEVVGPEEGLEF